MTASAERSLERIADYFDALRKTQDQWNERAAARPVTPTPPAPNYRVSMIALCVAVALLAVQIVLVGRRLEELAEELAAERSPDAKRGPN